MIGSTISEFAYQAETPSPSREMILIAKAKTISIDETINKASQLKRGSLLKARMEKQNNQVACDVRIEGPRQAIASVQIDPQRDDAIKVINLAEEVKSLHLDNS